MRASVERIIVLEEVRRGDDGAHLGLEVVGLRVGPVALEAGEIVRARAAAGIELRARFVRQLARMAAGAGLGEHGLAALERGRVGRQVFGAARRVGEPVGLAGLEQELGHERRAGLGRAPIGRVRLRRRDRDRVDRLAAEERIEVAHPFFAVEADVDVDAVQRPEHADRIGAVLQHARRPRGRPAGRRSREAACCRAAGPSSVSLPQSLASASRGPRR